ncbi:hypothetical protein CAEBREN_03583 [Caenorhabditis brenneri]|uniref:Uncharacterized protein n=1 Tax=Caenorhabditis brenneri TaxID=135651 RepID=G0N2V2_CAEBE|nr:hypothetical protein CAEBREN_03583 [Caenorhabditis brenneri]
MVGKPTFPLYRLPYVALKVAFGCSHPHDILRLSMVSKKSYTICKIFRKKVRNLNVRFDFLSDICSDCMATIFKVKSNSEVLPEDSKLESLKIKDTEFNVKMDRCIHILNFYCDDRVTCLTTLYEYLTDFYEVPFHQVELDGDSMTALDGVLAQQQTLAHCFLRCSKSGDEEVRWFLDRVENRVTRLLSLDVKTSKNFRLNLRLNKSIQNFSATTTVMQSIKTDMICFGRSFTLSIDNLSKLHSRGLFAEKTSLTCENLNSYLKNWQNGGNPNLGSLKLGLKSINVDTVLNGIEFNHRRHQNDVAYSATCWFPWNFNESYEIRRNDGTIASIVMQNGQNGEFKLCVWPDLRGTVYPESQ